MKKDPFANLVLDEEEQDLEDNFAKQLPLSTEETAAEMKMLRQAALNSLIKTKFITLRINEQDLIKLKNIAAKEGLKYQIFISSILHKVTLERASEAYE